MQKYKQELNNWENWKNLMVSYATIPQRPQKEIWKTISIKIYSVILKHNNNISLHRKSSSDLTKKTHARHLCIKERRNKLPRLPRPKSQSRIHRKTKWKNHINRLNSSYHHLKFKHNRVNLKTKKCLLSKEWVREAT